jgi:hypothetical protein
MEALVARLLASENIAITALLAGNVAQAAAIIWSWRYHAKERETERKERTEATTEYVRTLEKLADLISELRITISQCVRRPK